MSFNTLFRPFQGDYNPGKYYYHKMSDAIYFIKSEFVKATLSGKDIHIIAKQETLIAIQEKLSQIAIPTALDGGFFDIGSSHLTNLPLENTTIELLTSYHDSFELLNHKVLENWTVLDVLKLLADSKEDIVPYPFIMPEIDFNFSGEEYYDLTKVIQTYRRFQTLNTKSQIKEFALQQFNKRALINSDKEALQAQLSIWIEQLRQIKRKLLSHLLHHQEINEHKATNKKIEALEQITAAKHKVYYHISIYGNATIQKPTLFSLDKGKKKRFEDWKLLLNELGLDADSPQQLINHLDKRIEEIVLTHKNSILSIQKGLKSLNGYNTQNQNLINDIQSFSETITQINTSQLFTENIEDNAKSIFIKIEQLDKLVDSLHLLTQCRDIDGILEWYQLRSTLGKGTLSFLKQLSNAPADEWKYQFDYFYFSQLLKHFDVSHLARSNNDTFEFKDAINQIDAIILHTNQEALQHCLNEIKQSSKATYKKLTNTVCPLSEAQPFLSGVSIVRLDQQLLDTDEIRDSSIIYLDKVPSHEYTGSQSYYLTPRLSEADQWVFRDLNISTALSNTPIGNQLEVAKSMASNLFPILDMAIGFQFKNKNLLNLVHRHWQDDISSSLSKHGGKEFIIQTVDELTDFILSTERPLYILIQDKMINNRCNDLRWMALTTQDLVNAGFQLLNISSTNLINNLDQSITNITDTLELSSYAINDPKVFNDASQ